MSKLSIIIPAWNEENTLETVVEKVLKVKLPHNFEKEIIIINDGSKDRTLEIMQNLSNKYSNVKSFDNEKNMGKTQSVRNGILKSTGEYVIIQDADMEYEPEEISSLLNLIIEKDYDVVYGDRFGQKNAKGYIQNYLGNKFLSFVSNLFTYPRIKTKIPDMEVCYKLVKGEIARDVAQYISTKSKFGLEPEITARLARYKKDNKHLVFGIHPISYKPRSMAEGKKMRAFEEGAKAIKEIVRYNIFK